jgi:hypothetical protein
MARCRERRSRTARTRTAALINGTAAALGALFFFGELFFSIIGLAFHFDYRASYDKDRRAYTP